MRNTTAAARFPSEWEKPDKDEIKNIRYNVESPLKKRAFSMEKEDFQGKRRILKVIGEICTFV